LEKNTKGFVNVGFAASGTTSSEVRSTAIDPSNSQIQQASLQILEEKAKTPEEARDENLEYSGVAAFVKGRFERSKQARQTRERIWLECYNNFRGIYGPDTQFSEKEKSRAFIKITKTKVLAAYGKIISILFSEKRFPIGVEATPVPEGIAESVYFDPKQDEAEKSLGENKQLKMPGTIVRKEIQETLKSKLGPYKESLARLPESTILREGSGPTPTSVTFEPARMAALKADKQIQDQLEEADANKHLRAIAHEMCLFGSGIMKGPLAQDKEYPRWDAKGVYTPVIMTIPDVQASSVWQNYPDPEARTKDECEFWIERHRMTRSQLRQLKKRPYFRKESIDAAIEAGPNYQFEYWENILDDNEVKDNGIVDRYEVLEYWGTLDKELAELAGLEVGNLFKNADEVQVNIWICNNQILRIVLNPFTPAKIPYFIVPYELNPYSLWGIGIAENMLDTQLIMNGFMRLAIDNAALSSNVVFEVDETTLIPGQDMSVYPGKVFRRQGGAPGQSIYATKFPNVTQECMLLFDKARQLSDESTGMPSYAHGMSGIQSTGRTASGMSMLMSAADENIRSVIRNVDDYLLVPLGQSLYAFNMQFNYDKELNGDITVVARGTDSLLRNEIRSQKLMQFLQIASGEADIPYTKRDVILREIAYALDLDPDKVINNPAEAAIQAELIKKMRQAMGTDVNPMQQQGGAPSAALPGVGSPGTGDASSAPTPGSPQFSASPQQPQQPMGGVQ
jgi:hypothetical protein